MAEQGYSGRPLAAKLGIAAGTRVAVVDGPAGFASGLPGDADVVAGVPESADVVVAFFERRADLERLVEALATAVFPAGGVWIAWPKRSSGKPTDLDDNAIREVVLPLGLVDNKVCAIDETWSGLRLVWRRQLRGGLAPGGAEPP